MTPADKSSEVTANLSGRYLDKGTAFSKDGKPLGEGSLTKSLYKLGPSLGAGLTNSDVVVVVGPQNDVIEVQWWQGDEHIATMTRPGLTGETVRALRQAGRSDEAISRETYQWQKCFVRLVLGSAAGVSPVVSGGYEESLRLRKAVDGSLVVLHRNAGFWVVVAAPVWRQQAEWYRFPPVGDAAHGDVARGIDPRGGLSSVPPMKQ